MILPIIHRGMPGTVSQLATISRGKAKPATFRHLFGKNRDLVSNVEPMSLVAEYWPWLSHSVTSKLRIIQVKSDANLKAFLRPGDVDQAFWDQKGLCRCILTSGCPRRFPASYPLKETFSAKPRPPPLGDLGERG